MGYIERLVESGVADARRQILGRDPHEQAVMDCLAGARSGADTMREMIRLGSLGAVYNPHRPYALGNTGDIEIQLKGPYVRVIITNIARV